MSLETEARLLKKIPLKRIEGIAPQSPQETTSAATDPTVNVLHGLATELAFSSLVTEPIAGFARSTYQTHTCNSGKCCPVGI